MSGSPSVADAAINWHDAECGSYAADLPLWEELAARAGGPVLDLGCGTGRVAIHLARRGHEVVAVDRSEAFVEELRRRAGGLPVSAAVADVVGLDLERHFPLALAPMQLVQLLDGAAAREAFLHAAASHLLPGGMLALAIVEELPAGVAGPEQLPDIREVEGWVYSSLPLDVVAAGDSIVVRRLRQLLSPAGDLTESVDEVRLRRITADELEAEARRVGLRPAGRREVEATAEHHGSSVLLLEGDR